MARHWSAHEPAPRFTEGDAWEAVRGFYAIIPQIEVFARSMTGNPRLAVHATAGTTSTDGDNIYIRPPLGFSRIRDHQRDLCGKRDKQHKQWCDACDKREIIDFEMFHEISHVVFKSTSRASRQTKKAFNEYVDEWHPAVAHCSHRDELLAAYDARRMSGIAVGGLMNVYMKLFVNALEDIRVDEGMFRSRNGLRQIFLFNLRRMLESDTDYAGKHHEAIKADLNTQFVLGSFAVGSDVPTAGVLNPKVIDDLHDTEVMKILLQASKAKNVDEIVMLAWKLFREANRLGYCVVKKCVPSLNMPSDDEPEGGEENDSDPGRDESNPGDEAEEVRPEEADAPGEPEADTPPGSEDGDGQPDSEGEKEEPTEDGDDESADGGSEPSKDQDDGASDPDDSDSMGDAESPAEYGDDEEGSDDDPHTGDRSETSTGDSDMSSGSGNEDSSASDSTSEDADDSDDGQMADDPSDTEGLRDRDGGDDDGRDGSADDVDLDDLGDPWADDTNIESLPMPEASFGPHNTVLSTDEVPKELNEAEMQELEALLDKMMAHGVMDDMAGGDLEETVGHKEGEELTPEERQLLATAIRQFEYFDNASRGVSGVEVFPFPYSKWPVIWNVPSQLDIMQMTVPGGTFAKSILAARRAFDANRRAHIDANRKSGRVQTGKLALRAPLNDPRLFGHKVIPGRRSYSAEIVMDISGSMMSGNRMVKIKRMVYMQAEIFHTLGIKFTITAHSGGTSKLRNAPHDAYALYILPVKTANEAWNDATKAKLAGLRALGANLDGHALEYARKLAERSNATDRVIIYYSDGQMPHENYSEEKMILEREIGKCSQERIKLLGVGINTDSPSRYGMETVLVESDEDTYKVIAQLEIALTR